MIDQVPKLLWCDVETTGLDPHCGYLLEVGMVVTDPQLAVVDETSVVIGRPGIEGFLCPKVTAMHMQNGLLEEVENSTVSDNEAEGHLLSFLHSSGGAGLPLAGSNPQFDRRWIRCHMPRLHNLFHYRNFDVSTIRTFFGIKKAKVPHRALGDLHLDIQVLRNLQKNLVNFEIASVCS